MIYLRDIYTVHNLFKNLLNVQQKYYDALRLVPRKLWISQCIVSLWIIIADPLYLFHENLLVVVPPRRRPLSGGGAFMPRVTTPKVSVTLTGILGEARQSLPNQRGTATVAPKRHCGC